ncbi:hypothetical protein KTO58_05480 [Chitinophaga pendula]|uniref:hypothetical protein n=1 Tax=Chitinophaga TaxID=79328 RepID=UPI0012FD54AE|nr:MULTISPECIES: hypothetical protein [Chitinophaga]UCJ08638.1 hypothetical protein KTO58_05480 [Chitinophaga pendula]
MPIDKKSKGYDVFCKNAFKAFQHSAKRLPFQEALTAHQRQYFIDDFVDRKDIIAFHIYLSVFFFIERKIEGKIKFQLYIGHTHSIHEEIPDAERELFEVFKSGWE